MKECNEWFDKFYELKAQKNPDPEEMVLVSSTEIEESKRSEYERSVAKMRLSINSYLEELETYLDSRIAKETQK